MSLELINANAIKLRLMAQFYGIEEYLDMREPLPEILKQIDHQTSEFSFITAISNLDIWYIRVTNTDNDEKWNPFKEPLSHYAQRHQLLTAHLFSERQWPNRKILRFLGLPKGDGIK